MRAFSLLAATVLLGCNGEGTDDTGSDDTADDVCDTAQIDTGEVLVSGGLDPLPGTMGIDGFVDELLVHEGVVYVGGMFESIGPPTGPLAALEPDGTWDVDAGLPVIGGQVQDVISDGQGGLYIAGDLQSADGLPVGQVIHVQSDGTVDPCFQVEFGNFTGTSLALALGDTALYIGIRAFTDQTQINGETRSYAAAVSPITGAVRAWNPRPDVAVRDIAVDGDVVYMAGEFDQVGGSSRRNLVAVDATTGAVTSWTPAVTNANFYTGVALAPGAVLAWGGGPELVAFGADGEIAWRTQPPQGLVNTVAVGDGVIWVGGSFTTLGGEARDRLAALDPATGVPLESWDARWGTFANPQDDPLIVKGVLQVGTTVYAALAVGPGGTFHETRLVGLDASTGTPTSFDVGLGGDLGIGGLIALAPLGSDVVAGGQFVSAGSVSRTCLAALDATTGAPTDWAPAVDALNSCVVTALARDGETIYVAGTFDSVDGEARAGLAAVDTSGTLLPWNPGADNQVQRMLVVGGTVYASGPFDTLGGEGRNGLGAIDGTTGAVTSWNPDPDNSVGALASDGDILYVGGNFGTIAGASRARLAAFDIGTGAVTSWNPSADALVGELLAHDGVVYAGGFFTQAGGAARPGLAALDANGLATAWDPAISASYVGGLRVAGADLYVAGVLTASEGDPSMLARVSLATGASDAFVASGSEGFPSGDALAIDPSGRVWLGGSFRWVADVPAGGLAAFDP